MANFIACRVGVYAGAEDPFALLADAGVAGAEVAPPEDGDYAKLRAAAEKHGVSISSTATQLDLPNENIVTAFEPVIAGTGSIGTKIIFVSAKGDDNTPRAVLVDRLKKVGDVAAKHNVIISVETHPPFAPNGSEGMRTMKDVDHPNIRINFDTANIYYYNENVDTVEELKKEVDYVASVHLKDTDGGYHSPNFPVLGEGIVDFPRVFEILGAQGFTGPYTMELEGPLTAGKSIEERHDSVKACMAYLRSIGACA